jgi:hypothetical protein
VQPEWEDFFDALEPVVQSVPIVSAHGNHEVMAINYFAQFAMPGDEENYGLDYGPLHLTVLNDSPTDSTDIQGKVATFLQTDLTAHDSQPWKFVMHHRPAYSSATAHGSDPMLQATFGPIFDQHHVDLVLNGHDHDYERSKPLKAGAVQADPSMGTVYIVNGGMGAELYDNGTNFFTATSMKVHSAMVLHIRGKQLTLDAFDPTGAPVDSYQITKP